MKAKLALVGMLTLAFIGGNGCNKHVIGKVDKTYDKLSWIGEAYMQATEKLGRGPATVEELKPYLERYGDLAEVIRSDNDHEEFVILWNVDYRVFERAGTTYPVVAFERSGKNGMRYLVQMRVVSHLSDEDFRAAPFPAGYKPPMR